MTNRLNLSGQGWTDRRTTVTSVDGTNEYTVTPADTDSFGKALFTYRQLSDGVILPVPHTDFSHELNNQSYEFWLTDLASLPFSNGEKVAFFKDGATQKMRIYPTPTDVRTYVIRYAVGALDWSQFSWSNAVVLPEWSYLRTLRTALHELPGCEWEGFSFEQNLRQQAVIAASLNIQAAEAQAAFDEYVINPHHEPIADSGYWDD